MNWTGGRLRRHSETNAKNRKQTFGKSASKGPCQISLFNSFTRAQKFDEKSNRQRKDASPQPQSPNAITTNGSSEPSSRLEHLKRQLLETTDWGAVAAARPVKVFFTPKEDLERFGKRRRLTKNDHERLGAATPLRPQTRELIPPEWGVPENLEIRINGHRAGQRDKVVDEGSLAQNVSSQSMLLDHESACSNHRLDARHSRPNKTSTSRTASKLSIVSNDSEPRFISDDLARSDGVSNAQEGPLASHESASNSIDWDSQEPTTESLQSNESSFLIPQPESPVRRRFTIDDQVIADREGRFMLSSSIAGQSTTQLLHGSGSGAYLQSSLRADNIGDIELGDNTALSLSTPIYPQFDWLPEPYRDLPRTGSKIFRDDTFDSLELERRANFPKSSNEREQYPGPTKIFGQPVGFPVSKMEDHGSAIPEPNLVSPTAQAYSKFLSAHELASPCIRFSSEYQ